MPTVHRTTNAPSDLIALLVRYTSETVDGGLPTTTTAEELQAIPQDALLAVIHGGLTRVLDLTPQRQPSVEGRSDDIELEVRPGRGPQRLNSDWLVNKLSAWLIENQHLNSLPAAASSSQSSMWFLSAGRSSAHTPDSKTTGAVALPHGWDKNSKLIRELSTFRDRDAPPLLVGELTPGGGHDAWGAVLAARAELDRRWSADQAAKTPMVRRSAGAGPSIDLAKLCRSKKLLMLHTLHQTWKKIKQERGQDTTNRQCHVKLYGLLSVTISLVAADISPSSQYFNEHIANMTNDKDLMSRCRGAATWIRKMHEDLRNIAGTCDDSIVYGLDPQSDSVFFVLMRPHDSTLEKLQVSTTVLAKCNEKGALCLVDVREQMLPTMQPDAVYEERLRDFPAMLLLGPECEGDADRLAQIMADNRIHRCPLPTSGASEASRPTAVAPTTRP